MRRVRDEFRGNGSECFASPDEMGVCPAVSDIVQARHGGITASDWGTYIYIRIGESCSSQTLQPNHDVAVVLKQNPVEFSARQTTWLGNPFNQPGFGGIGQFAMFFSRLMLLYLHRAWQV